ncbi:MAG: hypothetical protein IT429_25880 [Gemmataceae bacterium]|nr:hypothetical protein [Gemmataceae bacterium]
MTYTRTALGALDGGTLSLSSFSLTQEAAGTFAYHQTQSYEEHADGTQADSGVSKDEPGSTSGTATSGGLGDGTYASATTYARDTTSTETVAQSGLFTLHLAEIGAAAGPGAYGAGNFSPLSNGSVEESAVTTFEQGSTQTIFSEGVQTSSYSREGTFAGQSYQFTSTVSDSRVAQGDMSQRHETSSFAQSGQQTSTHSGSSQTTLFHTAATTYREGSVGGGSASFSSVVLTDGGTQTVYSHQSAGWGETGTQALTSGKAYAQANAASWTQLGSFAGDSYAFSSMVYDASGTDQTTTESSASSGRVAVVTGQTSDSDGTQVEGTGTTSLGSSVGASASATTAFTETGTDSRTLASTSAGTYSAHEEGAYSNGSQSLSCVALQQSSLDSYTLEGGSAGQVGQTEDGTWGTGDSTFSVSARRIRSLSQICHRTYWKM